MRLPGSHQGIHARLYLGFGVAVVILLIMAGIGAYYESLYRVQWEQMRVQLNRVTHEVGQGTQQLNQLAAEVEESRFPAAVQTWQARVDHELSLLRSTTFLQGRPVWVPIGVAVVTALLLTMFAGSIVHSIRGRLMALAHSLTTLGARRGDLTQKIPVKYDDDIGRVAMAFNDMLDGLALTLQQVKSGAMHVAEASVQIRHAAEEQAGGVSQQSIAVTQVTKTVADMALAVQSIAERAHTVSEATERVLGHLREMQTKVIEMARRVTFLDEKGQSISRITAIIDSFAEQTNLLALNASIEAAHAGDAGKGFAIVAGEIRKLSERSTESTTEIRDLISEIRAETHVAAQWADESARQMARGLELVEEAVSRMREIHQTTSVQQQSVRQVVTAMQNIEDVTSQFLTSTRQTQMAAQQLDRQAEDLSRTIQGFVVDGHA